jgi:hypothetical protein
MLMPGQKRGGCKNRNELFKLGFPGFVKAAELISQREQDELFAAGDRGTSFLVATQNQKLLMQEQHLKCFLIGRQVANAKAVPKQGNKSINDKPNHK